MATTTPVQLAILKAISDARNAHGLRLQDPVRYNAYCAKRILSLKKAIKFVHRTKKSAPKPVTPDLVAQDSRCVAIAPPNMTDPCEGTLKLSCFRQSGRGVRVRR